MDNKDMALDYIDDDGVIVQAWYVSDMWDGCDRKDLMMFYEHNHADCPPTHCSIMPIEMLVEENDLIRYIDSIRCDRLRDMVVRQKTKDDRLC